MHPTQLTEAEAPLDDLGEPDKAMRVKTQDGPITINGWALFGARGDNETELTLGGEFPGMDDSMEETIRPLMGNYPLTV